MFSREENHHSNKILRAVVNFLALEVFKSRPDPSEGYWCHCCQAEADVVQCYGIEGMHLAVWAVLGTAGPSAEVSCQQQGSLPPLASLCLVYFLWALLTHAHHSSISHEYVCREGEFCRNLCSNCLCSWGLHVGKKKSSWAGMPGPPLPTLLWTYPKVSGVACICHSLLALSHCLLSKSQTASFSPPGWFGLCYFVLKPVCFFNGYK